MDIKKLLGILVVVFFVFWIISAPTHASGSVNHLLGNLKGAGNSMTNFVGGVVGTDGGSSGRGYSSSRNYDGAGDYSYSGRHSYRDN